MSGSATVVPEQPHGNQAPSAGRKRLGAQVIQDGVQFRCWAPKLRSWMSFSSPMEPFIPSQGEPMDTGPVSSRRPGPA
jgi:hypothetical protein